MTNKFTIEISNEALELINAIKPDDKTVEVALADLVDIGLSEVGRSRVASIRGMVKGTPLEAMIDSMEKMLGKINPNRDAADDLPEDHPIRKMREAMKGAPVLGITISKDGGIEGLEDLPPPIRDVIEGMRGEIENALATGGDVQAILQRGMEGAAGVVNVRDVLGDVCDCENCVARREAEVKLTPPTAMKS